MLSNESRGRVLNALWMLTLAIVPAGASPGFDGTPARVENPVSESNLTRIQISADAERRLGIRTEPLRPGMMERRCMLPGFVAMPAAGDVVVASPIAGEIRADGGREVLSPGRPVRAGEILLRIVPASTDGPMLMPSDRIAFLRARSDLGTTLSAAEGTLGVAEAGLEASRIHLERTQRLRQNNAAAEKALDDATAENRSAKARQASAAAVVAGLRAAIEHFERDCSSGIPVVAPMDAVLAEIRTGYGQIVTAGAPLLRVTRTSPAWIRVPVPVGECARINREGAARITGLDDGDPDAVCVALPTAGPRTTNPDAGTVDIYYEWTGGSGAIPGRRVGVALPTTSPAGGLIVAVSGIVTDIHGGDWVYEQVAPRQFVRRRVEVANVSADRALVTRGPAEGTQIVVAGAAELLGIEFGAGK